MQGSGLPDLVLFFSKMRISSVEIGVDGAR